MHRAEAAVHLPWASVGQGTAHDAGRLTVGSALQCTVRVHAAQNQVGTHLLRQGWVSLNQQQPSQGRQAAGWKRHQQAPCPQCCHCHLYPRWQHSLLAPHFTQSRTSIGSPLQLDCINNDCRPPLYTQSQLEYIFCSKVQCSSQQTGSKFNPGLATSCQSYRHTKP